MRTVNDTLDNDSSVFIDELTHLLEEHDISLFNQAAEFFGKSQEEILPVSSELSQSSPSLAIEQESITLSFKSNSRNLLKKYYKKSKDELKEMLQKLESDFEEKKSLSISQVIDLYIIIQSFLFKSESLKNKESNDPLFEIKIGDLSAFDWFITYGSTIDKGEKLCCLAIIAVLRSRCSLRMQRLSTLKIGDELAINYLIAHGDYPKTIKAILHSFYPTIINRLSEIPMKGQSVLEYYITHGDMISAITDILRSHCSGLIERLNHIKINDQTALEYYIEQGQDLDPIEEILKSTCAAVIEMLNHIMMNDSSALEHYIKRGKYPDTIEQILKSGCAAVIEMLNRIMINDSSALEHYIKRGKYPDTIEQILKSGCAAVIEMLNRIMINDSSALDLYIGSGEYLERIRLVLACKRVNAISRLDEIMIGDHSVLDRYILTIVEGENEATHCRSIVEKIQQSNCGIAIKKLSTVQINGSLIIQRYIYDLTDNELVTYAQHILVKGKTGRFKISIPKEILPIWINIIKECSRKFSAEIQAQIHYLIEEKPLERPIDHSLPEKDVLEDSFEEDLPPNTKKNSQLIENIFNGKKSKPKNFKHLLKIYILTNPNGEFCVEWCYQAITRLLVKNKISDDLKILFLRTDEFFIRIEGKPAIEWYLDYDSKRKKRDACNQALNCKSTILISFLLKGNGLQYFSRFPDEDFDTYREFMLHQQNRYRFKTKENAALRLILEKLLETEEQLSRRECSKNKEESSENNEILLKRRNFERLLKSDLPENFVELVRNYFDELLENESVEEWRYKAITNLLKSNLSFHKIIDLLCEREQDSLIVDDKLDALEWYFSYDFKRERREAVNQVFVCRRKELVNAILKKEKYHEYFKKFDNESKDDYENFMQEKINLEYIGKKSKETLENILTMKNKKSKVKLVERSIQAQPVSEEDISLARKNFESMLIGTVKFENFSMLLIQYVSTVLKNEDPNEWYFKAITNILKSNLSDSTLVEALINTEELPIFYEENNPLIPLEWYIHYDYQRGSRSAINAVFSSRFKALLSQVFEIKACLKYFKPFQGENWDEYEAFINKKMDFYRIKGTNKEQILQTILNNELEIRRKNPQENLTQSSSSATFGIFSRETGGEKRLREDEANSDESSTKKRSVDTPSAFSFSH